MGGFLELSSWLANHRRLVTCRVLVITSQPFLLMRKHGHSKIFQHIL